VTINGPAIELLKLTTHLASIGLQSTIQSAKNSVNLRLEDFLIVIDDNTLNINIDSGLEEIIFKNQKSDTAHQEALAELKDQLEGKSPITESLGWENILKPHQLSAANAMTIPGLRGICLFDEQGVGKTLTTIAAFDIIKNADLIDAMLVVAPKTLVNTWIDEFGKFLPGKYRLINISGNKLSRFRASQKSSDVYFITYESLTTDASIVTTLLRQKRTLLTVDESFFAKNPNAKRSLALQAVRSYANRAFVLCGTPAPNHPKDVISQVDLCDEGFTFKHFQSTDNEDLDRLNISKLLDSRAPIIRRTKLEVLPDLPGKQFRIINYDLLPYQRQLYDEAKKQLVLFLHKLDNSTFKRELATYFQKRAALLQICISPALIGDQSIDSSKYVALLQLVDDLVKMKNEKVVIWSAYTKSTNHIEKLMSNYEIARVDGTVTDSDARTREINRFQKDPNCKIFLGNPAAAGAGVTLTAANNAIYVSLSNQVASYMQSLDRIHRIGQNADQVNYFFLIANDTIEESEISRISRKHSAQSDLLMDLADPSIDLQSAINELR